MSTSTPCPPNEQTRKAPKRKSAERCPDCLMKTRLCICSLIPTIESRCRLSLVVHYREIRKPSNTGVLACQSLPHSRIFVRGAQDQSLDYAELVQADNATNLFLFPCDEAETLDQNLADSIQGPIHLIVPDGNWGQAARVRRRMPDHAPMRIVQLPIAAPTEYKLRKEPLRRPEGMSTLEAIARTLALFDGSHAHDQLMEIFRIKVDRILWTKGMLPLNQVRGGIPQLKD